MYVVIGLVVAFAIGCFVGYLYGEVKGTQATYDKWARLIEFRQVENDYVDPAPRQVARPVVKHKVRFRRKHRKPFKDKYDRMKWFWGDINEVKRPKKWTKKMTKELIKQLEADLKGQLDEQSY